MTSQLPIISATQSSDFNKILKEKVLNAFMGLIPEEQLQKYIDNEINNFFENEQLVSLNNEKIEIKNPNYDTSNWSNSRTITKECLVANSKMTPFRQLVWRELHEFLQPKITTIINDEHSATGAKINEWLLGEVKQGIHEASSYNFSNMAMAMGGFMFHSALKSASEASRAQLIDGLGKAGLVNPHNSIPSFIFPFQPIAPGNL